MELIDASWTYRLGAYAPIKTMLLSMFKTKGVLE